MGDTMLSRFSRRTSGGRWIPEVDGLRFLAIALVLADHVAVMLGLAAHRSVVEAPFGSASLPTGLDSLTTIFRQGAVGVQVFFMVSGFVIALPFIRGRSGGEPVAIGQYLRRRVTRIEPPYLIVMLLLLVGASLAGTHVGLGHVVASLAYLHGAYYGTDSPLSSVAWLFIATVVLVPVALAVGAAFFVLIERPCMDPAWPEKLRDRLRATRDTVVIVDDPPIVLPDLEGVSVSQD